MFKHEGGGVVMVTLLSFELCNGTVIFVCSCRSTLLTRVKVDVVGSVWLGVGVTFLYLKV